MAMAWQNQFGSSKWGPICMIMNRNDSMEMTWQQLLCRYCFSCHDDILVDCELKCNHQQQQAIYIVRFCLFVCYATQVNRVGVCARDGFCENGYSRISGVLENAKWVKTQIMVLWLQSICIILIIYYYHPHFPVFPFVLEIQTLQHGNAGGDSSSVERTLFVLMQWKGIIGRNDKRNCQIILWAISSGISFAKNS